MNFRIVTTASYNYASVVDFCLPSWRKNSGANEILVRWHPDRAAGERTKNWFQAVQERCLTIRDAVRAAVADQTKLLILDADCLVFKNLEDGFAEGKPIAMARWPEVNMGVMFLNTDLDWPFCEFFDAYAKNSRRHIEALIRDKSRRTGADQDVFIEMLKGHDDDVAKLDNHVNSMAEATWNCLFCERNDMELLRQRKDVINILHLRIATSFGGDIQRFGFLKEIFKDYL